MAIMAAVHSQTKYRKTCIACMPDFRPALRGTLLKPPQHAPMSATCTPRTASSAASARPAGPQPTTAASAAPRCASKRPSTEPTRGWSSSALLACSKASGLRSERGWYTPYHGRRRDREEHSHMLRHITIGAGCARTSCSNRHSVVRQASQRVKHSSLERPSGATPAAARVRPHNRLLVGAGSALPRRGRARAPAGAAPSARQQHAARRCDAGADEMPQPHCYAATMLSARVKAAGAADARPDTCDPALCGRRMTAPPWGAHKVPDRLKRDRSSNQGHRTLINRQVERARAKGLATNPIYLDRLATLRAGCDAI